MSDKLYRLLLVDDDLIFRIGIRAWFEQFSDLTVVAEADNAEDALVALRVNSEDNSLELDIDLVILDLSLGLKNIEPVKSKRLSGLELCQQIKSQYPDLPILLLSSPQSSALVATALSYGVEGYCHKGTNPEELITAIRQVALGDPYLDDRYMISTNQTARLISNPPNETASVVAIIRHNLYLSGLRRIDNKLSDVNSSIQASMQASINASGKQSLGKLLGKTVLSGQARELQAARWLVHQILGDKKRETVADQSNVKTNLLDDITSSTVEISDRLTGRSDNNILAIQSSLWDTTVTKLQASLTNLSKSPLEIDILKDEQKRELLFIALRQVEQCITELRFSQVQPSQLVDRIPVILKDIWQETVIVFFGKYYTLSYLLNSEINVVDVLLKEQVIVQTELLDKIPQVDNLFSHLLFETDLVVNNAIATIGSAEAMRRAELILENLIVQIANGVVQPLLNHFADVEEIKHKFYRYNFLSTREVERFRNDLSWKYRLEKYVTDPQLIFESRHVLYTLANPGIRKTSVYSPRNQELQQLEGVQLAVTLVLELQDAIKPRLKSAITFLGSGFVYLLTNVIGRGIGLIGRGVVQGIGNAWQENRKK